MTPTDRRANLSLPWQPRTGKAKRAIKRAADPSGFESGMKHTIRKQTKAAEKKKRLTTKVLSTAHPGLTTLTEREQPCHRAARKLTTR